VVETHWFFLVTAVELPVTEIGAIGAGGLVNASWKRSDMMCNNAIVVHTYTNAIGGLDPVRIGWMTQVVAFAELSVLI
jgi:hypothetical protein